MISVSNQFLTDIENDNRNYRMYVDITLANSTVLHLTNEDLWEDGVRIEDSVSEDSKLEVGSAIINQCIVVLNNIEGTFSEYDFAEAEVVISVGLMLSTGTEERFVKGRFTVNEQNYDSSLVTLTCLDHMNRFERPYSESSLTYPATLTQIVADACVVCNVPMGSFSLLNGSVQILERPTDTTLTFRNVLTAIGQICCANARINASGQLEYKWYDLNQAVQIPSLYTINTAMDDTVVTGVRAVVLKNGSAIEYKSGVDGYYVSIENNLFITSDNAQTIVNAIATRAVGFRYRKANFTHLSDPHLEAGDTATIQDGHGNQYSVLLSTTVFTVGNRQESVSAGSTPARNRANQYSQEVKDYVSLPKPFYTWIAYAKDNLGTDISTNPTGRPFLGIAENQTTPTVDLSDPSVFTWSLYVGADATIVSQEVAYCLSFSGTDPADIKRAVENGVLRVLEDGAIRELEEAFAAWQSSVPGYEPDTYLWARTQIEYSDGTVVTAYTVSYNQPKVESVVSEYYLSTSDTTQSDGFWSETPAEYIDGRYYWKRDKTTWNNGTIEYSGPVLEQNMISAHEEASDAKKIATNYMSSDNTGIMVADLEDGEQTPSTATGRNVRITNTAVEVRDGQDVKASFGTEVVLGDTNESKLRLGDKYIRAQDSDNNIYYEVQDLRGEEITAIFYGEELQYYSGFGWACNLYFASEIVSVTIDDVATSSYTLEPDGYILWLTTDPLDGVVTVIYKTDYTSPAFTFGTRTSEEQGIFSAAFGEDNEASGQGSFASGSGTKASGKYSMAQGFASSANGFASHAHGYGTIAPNTGETAIGMFNKPVPSSNGAHTIAFYIGNGDNDADRHNALTVDYRGNIETNGVQSILSKLSKDLSGVDLNDITEPGNYSAAASAAITNTPFSTNPAGATSPAFSLMVFNSCIDTSTTSETVVLQVAWSKDAGAVRARIYQSLTWSAWQTLMSTSQPTFSRNTTNTSAVTMSLERVGDMVIGSFKATTRIQFTASTTYSLGTLSPVPVANSVFFARSGAIFNVQAWVGASDGNLNIQSGTAIAANQSIEGMFIYHPVQ